MFQNPELFLLAFGQMWFRTCKLFAITSQSILMTKLDCRRPCVYPCLSAEQLEVQRPRTLFKVTHLLNHTPTEYWSQISLPPSKSCAFVSFFTPCPGNKKCHILACCRLSLCPLPAGISSHSCPVVREHVSWGERKAQSYSFDNCAFQSRFVF